MKASARFSVIRFSLQTGRCGRDNGASLILHSRVGDLRESFDAVWDASGAAAARIGARAGEVIEIEAEASHAAADVIFRTLFSVPIDHGVARRTYHAFRSYQRSQPILNVAALLPLPRWVPRGFRPETRRRAAEIRGTYS